jgi:hypothetical protein
MIDHLGKFLAESDLYHPSFAPPHYQFLDHYDDG